MTAAVASLARFRAAWPAAALAGLAALYFVWARFVVIKLWSFSPIAVYGFPMRFGYEGYSRWDAAWYVRIADLGYFYDGPGMQSAVAYFPVYPAAVRVVGFAIPDTVQAGMVVTLLAGAAFVLTLHRWVSTVLTTRTAAWTVAIVLTWPYAYYLFGVVYSDALFLALAVGAFALLERRHPWLAAAVGVAAVAVRPIGLAVAVGLTLRSLELDRVLLTRWSDRAATNGLRLDLRRLRLSTLAPAASAGGLVSFCLYLWYRFREPFAFTKVGGAEGWNRDLRVATILKGGYVDVVQRGELTVELLTLTVSGIAVVGALLLTVRVLRRLGLAYAMYCVATIGIPFLTSPEFRGGGRYVLAAFPCFAVVAEAIARRSADRPLLPRLAVAAMFLLLGLFATYFIRGYYMA